MKVFDLREVDVFVTLWNTDYGPEEVEDGAEAGFDVRGEEPWAAVDDSPEVMAPDVGFVEEEGACGVVEMMEGNVISGSRGPIYNFDPCFMVL